jgi:hypothetical protein
MRPLGETLHNSVACTKLEETPAIRYIHVKGARLLGALLLIQSLVWKQLEKASRFQEKLKMMVFLLVRLMTWEFILSVKRLFHSLSFRSHRSFILVQPALVMARPSLNPFTPKGG